MMHREATSYIKRLRSPDKKAFANELWKWYKGILAGPPKKADYPRLTSKGAQEVIKTLGYFAFDGEPPL